jgi:hypothetical protein
MLLVLCLMAASWNNLEAVEMTVLIVALLAAAAVAADAAAKRPEPVPWLLSEYEKLSLGCPKGWGKACGEVLLLLAWEESQVVLYV